MFIKERRAVLGLTRDEPGVFRCVDNCHWTKSVGTLRSVPPPITLFPETFIS